MREKGMTIIYTTHYMEEVEEISTRIIVMDKGEIIATGTKEKLKEEIINHKQYVIEIDDVNKVCLEEFYNVEELELLLNINKGIIIRLFKKYKVNDKGYKKTDIIYKLMGLEKYDEDMLLEVK